MKIATLWTWSAVFALGLAGATGLLAVEARVLPDLSYKAGATPATGGSEHCRLDLYLPPDGRGFATIVWFHGGGLTGGSRSTPVGRRLAGRLAQAGIAVAMADYRLNPAVRFPAYIEDTAAAFAWVRENIAQHGGDPAKVFLGGHSAGAYLALMASLDDKYLAACGLAAKALAGVVAVSGQTSTHFTVRTERGLGERIIVDDAAPLYHVARRPFPFLILYAGHDMPQRPEENRLLATALRDAGTSVTDRIFEDRDHSTIITQMDKDNDAVAAAVIEFVKTTGPAEAKP